MSTQNSSDPIPFFKKIRFQIIALVTFLAVVAGAVSDGLNVFDRFFPHPKVERDSINDIIISKDSNSGVLEELYPKVDNYKSTQTRTRYYLIGSAYEFNEKSQKRYLGRVDATLTEVADGKYESEGVFSNTLCGIYNIYGAAEDTTGIHNVDYWGHPVTKKQPLYIHLSGKLQCNSDEKWDYAETTFDVTYIIEPGSKKIEALFDCGVINNSKLSDVSAYIDFSINKKEFLVK